MAKKIKLSDAAKDINVPAQELIDFFTEKGDNKKKTGSSLTEEEMNSVLEHYMKNRYSVDSLNDYFNSKNDPRPVKEEAPKAEKKPAAKKSEPKSEEKKAAAPAEKKEKAAPKKEEKPAKAAAPEKKEEPKPKQEAPAKKAEPEKKQETAPVKEAPKAEAKPEPKAEPVKAAEPEKKQETAPVKEAPKAETKPEAKTPAPTPEKKSDKKKDKKKTEPAKAQDRGERTKFNATFSSETAQTSTQRRTVDTRGSYVDLDKYNERYDQMAASNKHKNDNYSSKKQKINQKSA